MYIILFLGVLLWKIIKIDLKVLIIIIYWIDIVKGKFEILLLEKNFFIVEVYRVIFVYFFFVFLIIIICKIFLINIIKYMYIYWKKYLFFYYDN